MIVTRTMGHWNVGNRPHRIIFTQVMEFFDRGGSVFTLNEMGDQGAVYQALKAEGLGVSTSESGGGKKVGVIVDPEHYRPKSGIQVITLMPRTKGSRKAAGGKLNNGYFGPKALVAREYECTLTNRSPWFGSHHVVPSLYIPVQARMARAHMENLQGWVRQHPGLLMVNGDLNMTPGHEILNRSLGQTDLTSNHIELGEIPTFGRRAIDQCWGRGFDFRRQRTIEVANKDHRILEVTVTYSGRAD